MRTLVRHNPRYLNLFDNVDRMFGGMLSDDGALAGSRPRVDIREDENGYVLEAELAGMSEKDIEVKVEDNLLHLSAGAEEEKDSRDAGYLVRERRRARFYRSFVLPKDAEREKIDASFKDGLLTLSIPKAEAAKPRSIEVKQGK